MCAPDIGTPGASSRSRSLIAAAMVALAVLGFAGWPLLRVHLQAAAVLDLVANKPVPLLLRRFVSDPIKVQDLELPLASGAVRARLYTPVRPAHAPSIMVLHGVHHLGIDEPRLENFATAMASCGVRVLTPELPDIKDYQVGANSVRRLGKPRSGLQKRMAASPWV